MDEEEEFDDEDRLLQQELSQHIINEQDLLSIDDQSSVEDVMNQFNKEIEQHESDSEDMPQLEKLPSWSELLKTISVPVLQLDMKESLEYHQLQNTTSSGLENIKDVDAVSQSNIGETTRLITHNSADIIPTQSTEMLFAQSFGDLLPSTKIEHDTIKDNTPNIAVLDKDNIESGKIIGDDVLQPSTILATVDISTNNDSPELIPVELDITKSNGDAYSGLNSVLAVDDPTTIDLSDIKPIESINNEKNEFTINLAEEITETNQLSQETPQIGVNTTPNTDLIPNVHAITVTIQNDISNNIGKEETNTNHEVQPNLDASVFENLTQKVSDVKSRGSVKSQKSPQIEKLDLERVKNSGPKTPKMQSAKLSRQTSKLKNVTSLPDLSAIPNEHVRKESQTTKAPLAALLSDDSIFSTENNELAEKTKERKKSITSARRLVNSKLAIESIDEELEKEMSENEKAAIDIAPIKVENEKSNVEGKLIGVNHDRDLIIDKEHLKPKGQLVKGIAIAKRTRVGSVATTDREINYEHQLLLQGQKLTSEGFDSDLEDLSGSESDESRQSSAKSHRGSIKQMAERKLRRQSTTYARLEKKHIDDMDLEKLLQDARGAQKKKLLSTKSSMSIKEHFDSQQSEKIFTNMRTKSDHIDSKQPVTYSKIKKDVDDTSTFDIQLLRPEPEMETTGPTRSLFSAAKLQNMDPVDRAEMNLISAIGKKVQNELDSLHERILKLQNYQHSKSFGFEASKNLKALRNRALRDLRAQMPVLQDRKKAIQQYISEDFKLLFAKEKYRNNQLMNAALDLKEKLNRKKINNELLFEDAMALKHETAGHLKDIKKDMFQAKVQFNKAQDDVNFLKADYEKLLGFVNERRSKKMEIVQKTISVDNEIQIKELEILNLALEKRRSKGVALQSIKELDSVDLTDMNLSKLPVSQLDAEKVKNVHVGKNRLRTLEELENFVNLEAIISDENQLEELNLKDLKHLKALSVASNHLTELGGLSIKLQYLNASANKFTTLKGIESAPNLRILILSNSLMKDFNGISYLTSLLYLDISCSNLGESCIRELENLTILQYLNVSSNVFRAIPEIPIGGMYEMQFAKNILPSIQRGTWLFNLRVLGLQENLITDVQPLALCPYLRELDLSVNQIRHIDSIYNIGVCQKLEILNLNGNPVCSDPMFKLTIGALFPNLKVLNEATIEWNHYKVRRNFIILNLFKRVKLYLKVKKHIDFYVEDWTDEFENMEIWRHFAENKDQMIRNHMGKYFPPYLKYLTCRSSTSTMDPTVNLQFQERRLFWLGDAITDVMADANKMVVPTWDGSMVYFSGQLKHYINVCYITYVQSIWRMKMQKKKYLGIRQKIIKIQQCWRNYAACILPKIELAQLKLRRKELNGVIMIQKHWRGLVVRRKERERIKREEEEAAALREEAELIAINHLKSVAELPDVLLDHELELEKTRTEIDKWLAEDETNHFDQRMEKYLANESLIHYPGSSRKKQVKKPAAKKKKIIGKTDEDDLILDQIVVVRKNDGAEGRQFALTFESTSSEIPSSGGDSDSDTEELDRPISPTTVDLNHTVKLAKERNDIMKKMNRDFASSLASEDGELRDQSRASKYFKTLKPGQVYIEAPFDITRVEVDHSVWESAVSHTGSLGSVNTNQLLQNPFLEKLSQSEAHYSASQARSQGSVMDNTSIDSSSQYTRESRPVGRTKYDKNNPNKPTNSEEIHYDVYDINGRYIKKSERKAKYEEKRRYYKESMGPLEAIEEFEEMVHEDLYVLEQKKANALREFEEEYMKSKTSIPDVDLKSKLIGQKPAEEKPKSKYIFEWDIHPGQVAKKFKAEKPSAPIVPLKSFEYRGSGAEPKIGNYCSTEAKFAPPITLLINNYVTSKFLKPPVPHVDPNTIHRLEKPIKEPTGEYTSMLNLIPSQIKRPEYGSYVLNGYHPLPSINNK